MGPGTGFGPYCLEPQQETHPRASSRPSRRPCDPGPSAHQEPPAAKRKFSRLPDPDENLSDVTYIVGDGSSKDSLFEDSRIGRRGTATLPEEMSADPVHPGAGAYDKALMSASLKGARATRVSERSLMDDGRDLSQHKVGPSYAYIQPGHDVRVREQRRTAAEPRGSRHPRAEDGSEGMPGACAQQRKTTPARSGSTAGQRGLTAGEGHRTGRGDDKAALVGEDSDTGSTRSSAAVQQEDPASTPARRSSGSSREHGSEDGAPPARRSMRSSHEHGSEEHAGGGHRRSLASVREERGASEQTKSSMLGSEDHARSEGRRGSARVSEETPPPLVSAEPKAGGGSAEAAEALTRTSVPNSPPYDDETEVFTHGNWRKVDSADGAQPTAQAAARRSVHAEDDRATTQAAARHSVHKEDHHATTWAAAGHSAHVEGHHVAMQAAARHYVHKEEHHATTRAAARRSVHTEEHRASTHGTARHSQCQAMKDPDTKNVYLDLDNEEQVTGLIWRFGPAGGAFLKGFRMNYPFPENCELVRGDMLVTINGRCVKGSPKDLIEQIWLKEQDESHRYMHLELVPSALPLPPGR
uniref:PDZ domain-containing protein n=1 Tax=Alexandrium monilatum TaxID=311494 RepID=A0A7S4RFK4_9DINO